ncbi:MAG: hypothetical protein ABSD99_00140 [Candidatus Bathyarchaeia archaeon]
MSQDEIEITSTISQGTDSLFRDPQLLSAFGRPFRRLKDTGKPPGTVNYVFFKPPTGPLRTLGALGYTPGEQVLFYPGILTRRVPWYTTGNDKIPLTAKANESLDHITLEPDLQRWHATILTGQGNKETRLPRRRTSQIKQDLIFWFALSVTDPSVLELTPRTIRLGPFAVSPTYSRQMAKLIIAARKGAIFHILQLHEQENLSGNEFVNFEFYVDRSSEMRLLLRHQVLGREGRVTGIVSSISPPASKDSVKLPALTPCRSHDVMLLGSPGCYPITVYKLPGTLAEDAILSGY